MLGQLNHSRKSQILGKIFGGFGIIGFIAAQNHFQPDGTINHAGVKIGQMINPGQSRCQSAFAGRSRTVNRDNHYPRPNCSKNYLFLNISDIKSDVYDILKLYQTFMHNRTGC